MVRKNQRVRYQLDSGDTLAFLARKVKERSSKQCTE